jgi:hypothetical protein
MFYNIFLTSGQNLGYCPQNLCPSFEHQFITISAIHRTSNRMSDSSTLDLVARDIFFITTSKEPLSPSQQPLIYVEDVAASVSGTLSADLLAEAVLERLLLPEPQVFVVPLVNINKIPPEVIQVKLVTYLFESWQRLQEYGNKITYVHFKSHL